jgi:putative membrane protein insertion efficiency factor
VKFLGQLFAWPLLGLVWLYRYAISPLLGAHCRFQPSCSAYAKDALLRYGAFKGGWLMLKRIGRCHPWGGSGYDPVPIVDSKKNFGTDPRPVPGSDPGTAEDADESD